MRAAFEKRSPAVLGLSVLVLSVSVGAVACGDKVRAPAMNPYGAEDAIPNPDVPHERLPEASQAFTETACTTKVKGRVIQCGIVAVPESPGSTATIELAVARVFSKSSSPKADPIVYLDGGPGGASLGAVDWLHPALESMSIDRDFIFIDQRGVGRSRPSLDCTETQEDLFEALDACHARLSEGSDLDAYNSVNNATDIDLVRRAFGYDQWNLLGVSYGTRLGLTVARDYPSGVRSLLIDSVVPLQRNVLAEIGANGSRAFERVFAACAADSACAAAYPNPMAQLLDLVTRLNDKPADLEAWQLDGDYFLSILFSLLYSPSTIAYLPRIIDDAASDDFSIFEEFESGSAGGDGISFGMHLSLHCSEELPFSTPEDFEQFDLLAPEELRAGLTGSEYIQMCDHWPVAPAPPEENQPAVTDVPSLVLAGHFDPITPAEFAEAAHEFLTNSTYFLIENESHGASFGECGLELARDFFDDPGAEIDAGCLGALPELEFESLSAGAGAGSASAGRIRFVTSEPSVEEIEQAQRELSRRLR